MANLTIWSLSLVKERAVQYTVGTPGAVVGAARALLAGQNRECMYALFLNVKNSVIGARLISAGSTDEAPVPVAEIYKAALLANATSVILAHNHPTGNLNASVPDRVVAARVAAGCRLLGLMLVDFLIITDDGYTSAVEHGWPEITKED